MRFYDYDQTVFFPHQVELTKPLAGHHGLESVFIDQHVWCQANVKGQFSFVDYRLQVTGNPAAQVVTRAYMFERQEDAALFKMFWT